MPVACARRNSYALFHRSVLYSGVKATHEIFEIDMFETRRCAAQYITVDCLHDNPSLSTLCEYES